MVVVTPGRWPCHLPGVTFQPMTSEIILVRRDEVLQPAGHQIATLVELAAVKQIMSPQRILQEFLEPPSRWLKTHWLT